VTSTLIDGIGELVTCDGADDDPLGVRRDAAIVVQDAHIVWFGPRAQAPAADEVVDAGAGTMVPGFVDSHAHLVFAGDRATEFAARMAGASYSAGGIGTTVRATREASDAQLRANVGRLVGELIRSGTTTFEIKSGYGLTVADEQRSVRIAGEFTREVTFLGAHVTPAEYAGRREDYVDLVTGPMLEACAPHSRWIDVFCDHGAFDADESRRVLAAGRDAGLGLRVHANQLQPGPGVGLAVDYGAASADHCTHLSATDIDLLADSARFDEPTVATLLPGAEFSTRSPYPDARALLDAGALVALGHRLQSRIELHDVHATVHRPGGQGNAHDSGGGRYGSDSRGSGGSATRRCRADPGGRSRRSRPTGCAFVHPPRLPSRRRPGGRRLACGATSCWRGGMTEDPLWPRAGAWLEASSSRVRGAGVQPDFGLLGVPAHTTSLSATNAHLTPKAVRVALDRYSTWSASQRVDLDDLAAIDLGEVIRPRRTAGRAADNGRAVLVAGSSARGSGR
jgi:imidazolonepropionase